MHLSRQLFTLDNTSFSEKCWQHGPPFTPQDQLNPSHRNLFTFAIISSFSRTSLTLTLSHGISLSCYANFARNVDIHALLMRMFAFR